MNNDINVKIENVNDIEVDMSSTQIHKIITQADWNEDDPTKEGYIKNKPVLSEVATSGDYDDLSNKPTIPTKTSDLTNDSGFIDETILNKAINDLKWELGGNELSVDYDETVAYEKEVPSGTIDCMINKVGGMSYKSNNLAVNPTIINNVSGDYNAFISLENLSLPAGTYTISFHNVNTLNSGTRYYITANPSISYIYVGGNSTKTDYSITFTTTETTTNLYVRLQYTTGGNTGTTTNVMLNKGSTALPYEEAFSGIRDSAVTSIVSKDSNNDTIDTFTIPNEVQALTGYGWGINDTCYNYIDFENKKFIQKVVKYTFTGNETITKTSTVSGGGYRFNVEIPYTINTESKIVCDTLEYQTASEMYAPTRAKYGIAVRNSNAMYIYIDELANSDTTALATWLANNTTTICIQLATPVETDISQYLDDNYIEVEVNGSLTFTNQYQQAVPSEIAYLIEGVKSNE